jgi:hypothetical protein
VFAFRIDVFCFEWPDVWQAEGQKLPRLGSVSASHLDTFDESLPSQVPSQRIPLTSVCRATGSESVVKGTFEKYGDVPVAQRQCPRSNQ